MPKIQWTHLPEALRKHLLLRLKDRKITEDDLYQLKVWRDSEPEAPEGAWYKDFGSFKIVGEGQFPKTFLLKDSRRKATACCDRVSWESRRGGLPAKVGDLRI